MRRVLLAAAVLVGVGLVVVLSGMIGDEDPPASKTPSRPGAPTKAGALPTLGSNTIVFTCARRICVWNGRDRGPRALTRATGLGDSLPQWSPDGLRIAFVHSTRPARGAPPDAQPRSDLFVMNADGSDRRRVASRLAASSFYGNPFAWAPDGERIAVSVQTPGAGSPNTPSERFNATLTGAPSDLRLVDIATRRSRRLTTDRDFDAIPVWAGEDLVYARLHGGRRFRSDVRIIDGGSGRDRLLLRASGTITGLVAAPEGLRVAVYENGSGPGISVLDIAGRRRTTLVRRCCAEGGSWSADGRLLALNGPRGPLLDIIDVATQRLRRPRPEQLCLSQDFSPDAKLLLCTVAYGEEDRRAGGADLVLVDPATGKSRQLTRSAKAAGARWRPVGRGREAA